MRRGVTTTHTITPGIDLTEAKVYLTYLQGGATVLERVTGDEGFTVTASSITNVISQAESFLFAANNNVKAQLRWVTEAGVAGASNVFNFTVEDVLKPGEISYNTQYGIEITGESTVEINDTVTLTATTTPAGETVDWSSSDDAVATVVDGVVSGLTEGTVTITATLHDHATISDTIEITVTAAQNEEEGGEG